MKKYLIPNQGNFYKANLHTHSTISDGIYSPLEIKNMYMNKGYSIVAFTDHEVMVPHNQLNDENFLAITSTEISFNSGYEKEFMYNKCYHLNIYSKDKNKNYYKTFDEKRACLGNCKKHISNNQLKYRYNRVYSVSEANKIIKISKEEGCLVCLNHPVWSMQDYSDYIDLDGLWAIEWHNSCSLRCGMLETIQPIDDMLKKRKKVFPVASDDTHDSRDLFKGWVYVKANNLEYQTIYNALENGDFYSSNGPIIEQLFIEEGIVNIKTKNGKIVILSTERRYAKSIEIDSDITLIDIKDYINKSLENRYGNEYIRLTIIDENGNKAHTRAYYLNELL